MLFQLDKHLTPQILLSRHNKDVQKGRRMTGTLQTHSKPGCGAHLLINRSTIVSLFLINGVGSIDLIWFVSYFKNSLAGEHT